MKKLTKKRWLNALRSGRFKQTESCLKDGGGHCCLGVLCEVTGRKSSLRSYRAFPIEDDFGLPQTYVGLKPRTLQKLAKLNDSGENDFNRIAKWIEKNVRED